MIKCETLGMYEVSKNNPVLTSSSAVANYTFITDNGDLYLIDTVVDGDDYYKRENTIPAYTPLRGFRVADWAGQNLIVDESHIAYGSGEDYDDITAGTTVFAVDQNGKLAIAQSTPTSGIYFKAIKKVTLTQKAVVVRVVVVDADTQPSG